MPMHRKNTTRRGLGDNKLVEQPWFQAQRDRNRNRKKIAKASKRKNRK